MSTTSVGTAPLSLREGAAGGSAEPAPRRPREAAPAGADAAGLPLALLDGRFPQTVVALVDGVRVAVRSIGPVDGVAGDAPTVVLLHGIGSGAASWLHVALALGGAARVIAWDAPGYGESTPLAAESPSAADYADRLHALLTALRIDSCLLVGHSLGALMAAAFVAGPGRGIVRRLLLVSPARGYGAPDKDADRRQVLDGRLQSLARLGVDGLAAQSPDRMLSPAASAEARAWVRWNTARLNPAGYTQAVRMLCGDDILRHAGLAAQADEAGAACQASPPAAPPVGTARSAGAPGALPMPVEVHGGDADVVVPPDLCRHIAAAFGAPFTPIAGAGHASPVEQPAEVARRIADALAPTLAQAHAVSDPSAADTVRRRASPQAHMMSDPAVASAVRSAASTQAHAMSDRAATATAPVGSHTAATPTASAIPTGGTPR